MSNQNLLRSTPDYVVLHSFGRALTSSHGPEVLQLLHFFTRTVLVHLVPGGISKSA